MIEDDPVDLSDAHEHWVAYILGMLVAFECTILLISLIWL